MEKTCRINRIRRALLIRRRRRFCPTAHFVLRRCQRVSAILAFRFAVESMRIRVERSTTTRMARRAWCASEKAGLRRRIFLATNGTTIRAPITGIAARSNMSAAALCNPQVTGIPTAAGSRVDPGSAWWDARQHSLSSIAQSSAGQTILAPLARSGWMRNISSTAPPFATSLRSRDCEARFIV
jgi:hypothetical protein